MAEEETTTPVPHPEDNPAPEHVPDPVPVHEAHDDTRSIVDRLVTEVDALKETVASLAPQEQDSTPVRKPWTHRRMF